MKPARVCALVFVVVAVGLAYSPQAAQLLPTRGTRNLIALSSADPTSDQRATIALLEAMLSSGRLRAFDRRDDPLAPGHAHERLQQVYGGLSVLGAGVAVQRRNGQIISAFGVVYEGLAIDVTPRQSIGQVASALRTQGFAVSQTSAPMSILPLPDGSVELVYALRTDDGFLAYVSASDASIVLQLNQKQTQAAVGAATGTLGDAKKISTTSQEGTFVSQDALRPPAIQTFDLQGNTTRLITALGGQAPLGNGELARKADNVWTDGAVVDAHVHAGWVYDYYFKRHQRRGLDNNDLRMQSIVHPVRLADYRTSPLIGLLYLNAFYEANCRCIVYGEGLPPGAFPEFPNGVRNFATALDVVGHELTHAVTDASSRLVYSNESGALNEAFSDIMGASIEFFHQPLGNGVLKADYTMGEDLASSSTLLVRSLQSPTEFGQPDNYQLRQYIGATGPDFDSGGVHVNSGIANNAFYLAIEGGTNSSSGARVTGVGAANREQIEKSFYRAFTSMLSSTSTFYLARVATLQSARDLYGAGSGAERAIGSAWDAVGVDSPAAALTTVFTPRSVPSTTLTCNGVRPSFRHRVSVSEFQQVGYTVDGFEIDTFDSQLRPIASKAFTGEDFRRMFNECQPGSDRIGPGATACATLCTELGGRSFGYAVFYFIGFDDNGNFGFFNSDVLSLGLPARSSAETPITIRTPSKATQK
jgi:Zn-dependent metalloprotease